MRHAQAMLLGALALATASAATAETTYQKPRQEILDVLHAPLPPSAFLSPTRDTMILATRVRYPPIADLARPMLRLGGTRIDPGNNSVHGASYFSDYTITRISDGKQTRVKLPDGAHLSVPVASPDGKRFAFANTTPSAVELWVGDVAAGSAHRIGKLALDPMLGYALRWLADQRTLLVKLVPKRGAAPSLQAAPEGPKVQESSGETTASSTYEARDLLKNPHDATLFDYYATSQLALVDVVTGKVTPLGKPGLYTAVMPSPDGKLVLVASLRRPYSYITTYDRFPHQVELWDLHGKLVHTVASLPLVENVPIWGVPTGPRDFEWRANAPATLTYAEALDGGDWKKPARLRDRLLMLSAPWDKPVVVTELVSRFEGLDWREHGGGALVHEADPIKHWRKTTLIDADDAKVAPRIMWELSTDDHYKDPGRPLARLLPNGHEVLEEDDNRIFTSGMGSSPDGDRPFLDRWSLAKAGERERLFRSGKSGFEVALDVLDPKRGLILTRAESPTEHPNYFVRTLGAPVAAEPGEAIVASTARAITSYKDPTPQLRAITKKLVKYKRADGVDLSFTLYLPPGYKEGTRLPTVVWAYPLDYADAAMAGQVTGSTERFTLIGWPLQLFFLLDGYAVIDNPSMPVVGDTKKIYDTYMEQLTAGAKAAVDKAVAMGVTDPERVGITGHSHGGLMTANLLANTNLFRAGIARSGAYNHTLRPFGFQNERRTLWEAMDVYLKLSPMIHADKIKAPLLIIHGEADFNPGTVPLQSELLYQAVRGTGGHARLVVLPFESHGYQAMESTEHVLYEMLSWFDTYVKQAPPRTKVQARR